MIKALSLFATAFMSLALSAAHAQLVEGFEALPAGYSLFGDGMLVQGNFFMPAEPPPGGNSQLLLTTLSDAADGGSASGQSAGSAAAAASFLNLQASVLPTQGATGDVSAVKFTVTLAEGEYLVFRYRFLTNAAPADGEDFAFITWQFGSGAPVLQTFAQPGDATLASTSTYFDRQSAIGTFIVPAAEFDGEFTLGIGISDSLDDGIGSGLLIDELRIIPEAQAGLLSVVGALLLGGSRMRRRSALLVPAC